MSRIGKRPVSIPSGVSVEASGVRVRVKGPKGTLEERLPREIRVLVGDRDVRLERPDDKKATRALHGLARALVANMVMGVTNGFGRELEVHGVGYRVDVAGKKLRLQVGFSRPVEISIPEGLQVSVQDNRIRIAGADRRAVGQFASEVRGVRPPEPYKGKGIRYVKERVRTKVGKAGAG